MANFFTDNKDLRFHLTHPMMEKIVRLKEMDYRDKDQYDYAPHDFEDAMDNYTRSLRLLAPSVPMSLLPMLRMLIMRARDGRRPCNYARGTQENHEALTKAGVIGMAFRANMRD